MVYVEKKIPTWISKDIKFGGRLWHFLKYTLFHCEVNRRLYALIEALIGDPKMGFRFGGNTLFEHFIARQGLSASGKFSMQGVDRTHTKGLHAAKHLEINFSKDPQSILEVINEFRRDFQMRSETSDKVCYKMIYHILSSCFYIHY